MGKENGFESTLIICFAKLTIISVFLLKTNNFYHYWYKIQINTQEGAEERNILSDVTNLRCNCRIRVIGTSGTDVFDGLVVSMLASGTQVCGFKPGRSRWVFRT